MAPPSSVFIVGCPRSGTSVFFKTLAAHPACCSTTNLTRRFGARFGLVRAAELLGARHRPVEAEDLWRRFRPRDRTELRAEQLTPSDRRDLKRLVDDHRLHFDRPLFLSKWPGHSMRVGWTAAALPDARFVHVLRDGRAVANSVLRECKRAGRPWSYMGSQLWPELRSMPWAAYSGALWSRVTRLCETALEQLDPARVMTVRYERFVAEPHVTLAEVTDFCDLPFGPEHHAMIPALHDRNEHWREEMDAEERALMLEQAASRLTELGYGTG